MDLFKKSVIVSSMMIIILVSFLWMGNRNTCCAMDKDLAPKSSTFFIQARCNNETLDLLALIRKTIHPTINTIIKKELGLAADYDANFFYPKGYWQGLTLYSLRDAQSTEVDLITKGIDEVIHNQPKAFFVHDVALKPEIDFFGEHKDELVIMIDDANKELNNLNKILQTAMNNLNAIYKTERATNLYDVSNSEKFPYKPHIGLGRISSKIKQHIKDESQAKKIYGQIQEQIIFETLNVIKKTLTAAHSKITFTSVCLFDPIIPHRLLAENVSLDDANKQACFKEFILKQ